MAGFLGVRILSRRGAEQKGSALSPNGEIGRRAGLKSRCLRACRFESDFGHLVERPIESAWLLVRVLSLVLLSLLPLTRRMSFGVSPIRDSPQWSCMTATTRRERSSRLVPQDRRPSCSTSRLIVRTGFMWRRRVRVPALYSCNHNGGLAQRESNALTRRRSGVQISHPLLR